MSIFLPAAIIMGAASIANGALNAKVAREQLEEQRRQAEIQEKLAREQLDRNIAETERILEKEQNVEDNNANALAGAFVDKKKKNKNEIFVAEMM